MRILVSVIFIAEYAILTPRKLKNANFFIFKQLAHNGQTLISSLDLLINLRVVLSQFLL